MNEPIKLLVRVEFISKDAEGKAEYRTHNNIISHNYNGEWIWFEDVNGTRWYWNRDQVKEVKISAQLEKVKEEG